MKNYLIKKQSSSNLSSNYLKIPFTNKTKAKLTNQTSINNGYSSKPNRFRGHSPRALEGIAEHLIEEKIQKKYSKLDTRNLTENTNLIQKSYLGSSLEDSLEESQRPIKHGNTSIYSVGMKDLPTSKSARKVYYSYSKGRPRSQPNKTASGKIRLVQKRAYDENAPRELNFKKKPIIQRNETLRSSFIPAPRPAPKFVGRRSSEFKERATVPKQLPMGPRMQQAPIWVNQGSLRFCNWI